MINERGRTRKSQITIFVIIAILIVAILVFLFVPRFKEFIIPIKTAEIVPKTCIEDAVKENLANILLRGGKLNPQLYFRYDNESIQYLCYTADWYKTCDMQVPFLRQEIEKQISIASESKIKNCITQMENMLVSRGYNIQITGDRKPIIKIIPEKIVVSFNITLTMQKGESPSQTLPSSRFQTEITSKIYDLVMIASSILNYEARFGDSYPETFMNFYPNLKLEKLKQDDGTKVYIMTERSTDEKMQFATRSLAWPPGYAA